MIRLYEEFENQLHRPPNCPKSLKIEVIQTSLFVDVPDVLGTVLFEMPQRRSQNLSLENSLTSSTASFVATASAVYSVTATSIISAYFSFSSSSFFSTISVCNRSSAIKSHRRIRRDEEDIWSVLRLKDKQDLTSNNQTKARRDETHNECSDVIYEWFERYDRFNVCYLLNCYTSRSVRWNDSCI